jgi:hypothetical protein
MNMLKNTIVSLKRLNITILEVLEVALFSSSWKVIQTSDLTFITYLSYRCDRSISIQTMDISLVWKRCTAS